MLGTLSTCRSRLSDEYLHLPSLRYMGPIPHDASYYSKCMFGGALACGLTHAALTPLDVTKCNMQVCLVL